MSAKSEPLTPGTLFILNCRASVWKKAGSRPRQENLIGTLVVHDVGMIVFDPNESSNDRIQCLTRLGLVWMDAIDVAIAVIEYPYEN